MPPLATFGRSHGQAVEYPREPEAAAARGESPSGVAAHRPPACRFYAPRSKAEWTGTFYQYANRLAFHHFLSATNGLSTRLVFLAFTNAAEVDGPATEEEWHGATRLLHAALGLPSDLSTRGVHHAFLDARLLTDAR